MLLLGMTSVDSCWIISVISHHPDSGQSVSFTKIAYKTCKFVRDAKSFALYHTSIFKIFKRLAKELSAINHH